MHPNKPKPYAQGNFRKTPFAHILVYILEKQLHGTLEITDSDTEIAIYFRNGMPAKVTTTIQGKQLGQVLLDLGKITQDQLLVCQKEMATKGGLQGQILIQLGYIRAADLVTGITVQMMLKMVDGFNLPKAHYSFYEKVNLLTGSGPAELIQLDTYALLMAGIRKHGATLNLGSVLSTLNEKLLYLDDPHLMNRFNLSKRERILCRHLLEKPHTFDDISKIENIDLSIVKNILYVFTITKVLRTMDPEDANKSMPEMSTETLDSIAPPSPQTNSYPPEIQSLRDEIQNRAAAISTQNYFEMLGISPSDPPEDARLAFFKLAKTFHPDKASKAELEDLKETLQYLFANLSEAHSTLIDPDARDEYMTVIESGSKRTSVAPESDDEREIRNALEAENLFQKSLVLIRRKNYDKAFEFIDKAHQLNQNEGEYLATWAYLQMILETAEPEKLIPHFRTAESLNPKSERIHLFFGHVLKKANHISEAKIQFQKAVSINPHNIDSARELRILNMRETRSEEKKKKGFLSKFLK